MPDDALARARDDLPLATVCQRHGCMWEAHEHCEAAIVDRDARLARLEEALREVHALDEAGERLAVVICGLLCSEPTPALNDDFFGHAWRRELRDAVQHWRDARTLAARRSALTVGDVERALRADCNAATIRASGEKKSP